MKIENIEVYGFEAALRGMRNPMMSHDKSDSRYWSSNEYFNSEINWMSPYWIGENDMKLAQKLVEAGTEHAKFLRFIHVSVDVTAPRCFWSQFDTYKFVEKDSTSTMLKLLNNKEPITLEMFEYDDNDIDVMFLVIERLEKLRKEYRALQKNSMVKEKDIKLNKLLERAKLILPEGFLQMRTIDTNYAELRNMYIQRKNHRLSSWHEFCTWIEKLPYSKQLILGEKIHE